MVAQCHLKIGIESIGIAERRTNNVSSVFGLRYPKREITTAAPIW
jgi:hypothetical protein